MSLLPQRKKSPEELTRLRESLGVPTEAADAQVAPAAHLNQQDKGADVQAAEALEENPLPQVSQPRQVHSLKRAERARLTERPAQALAASGKMNGLRSIGDAEHKPLDPPDAQAPHDSKLPQNRHSKREIEELRRREALSMMNAAPNPRFFPAHPGILIPGYLLPLGTAAAIWYHAIPMIATALLALLPLLIAAYLFWRKPVSRHHAAFIALFAVFLIIFSALYYFPHLRHAT